MHGQPEGEAVYDNDDDCTGDVNIIHNSKAREVRSESFTAGMMSSSLPCRRGSSPIDIPRSPSSPSLREVHSHASSRSNSGYGGRAKSREERQQESDEWTLNYGARDRKPSRMQRQDSNSDFPFLLDEDVLLD